MLAVKRLGRLADEPFQNLLAICLIRTDEFAGMLATMAAGYAASAACAPAILKLKASAR